VRIVQYALRVPPVHMLSATRRQRNPSAVSRSNTIGAWTTAQSRIHVPLRANCIGDDSREAAPLSECCNWKTEQYVPTLSGRLFRKRAYAIRATAGIECLLPCRTKMLPPLRIPPTSQVAAKLRENSRQQPETANQAH
jgi:hypothetical protein